MDVFVEYLVKRKNGSKENLIRVLIIVGGIAAFILCMYLGLLFPAVSMITTLLAFGSIYGAYILFTNMNVEYEYIVTNGEMDVDKIIARRRRKRLLTANARSFEAFGPYHDAEHASENYQNRVYACISPDDEGAYYAVFNHPTLGRTLLVFSPNDRVLDGMKSFIPKKAGGNALYWNRPDGN